jgi:hypothetical protein
VDPKKAFEGILYLQKISNLNVFEEIHKPVNKTLRFSNEKELKILQFSKTIQFPKIVGQCLQQLLTQLMSQRKILSVSIDKYIF